MATTNSKIQILNPSNSENLLFPRIRLEDIRNSGNTAGILTADGTKIASTYLDVNSATTIPATGANDSKLPTEKAVKDYVDAALVAGVASVTGTAPVTATTNGGVVTLGITSATSTNSGVVRLASNAEIYLTSTANSGVITAAQFAMANAVIPFVDSEVTSDGAVIYTGGGNLSIIMASGNGWSSTTVGLESIRALGYNKVTSTLGKFVQSGTTWSFVPAFARNIGVGYGGNTYSATVDRNGVATIFEVNETKNNGVGLIFNSTNRSLGITADTASTNRLGTVATKANCATITTAEAASAALVPTVGALSAMSANFATAAVTSTQTIVNNYSTLVVTSLANCLVYSTITE